MKAMHNSHAACVPNCLPGLACPIVAVLSPGSPQHASELRNECEQSRLHVLLSKVCAPHGALCLAVFTGQCSICVYTTWSNGSACLFPHASLLSLLCTCRYIDGRVWPESDELEVRLMMDFIKHVTGE